MKIGNIELSGQVILAPMAGVCNSAFRKICKEMGASLVCAEMVSDKGMIYNSKKTILKKLKDQFLNKYLVVIKKPL